jgi:CDP-diacylglycerol--serine O-phosphatidyltransferase
MNLVKHIPNMVTLGNLACGTLAIVNIFNDEPKTAVYLVLLAAVLDFFDGFLARLLKVSGEFGKQLDSMADLVTFGIAPSCLLYSLSYNIDGVYRYSFLLLAAFSAYRLAKYNLDTRQTSTSFIGVPTPVTGITVMSLAMLDGGFFYELIFDYQYGFLIFSAIASYLLISEVKVPSNKLKKGPVSNYYQHIFLLATGVISIIFFQWLSVLIFYAFYVLSSIIINFAAKKSS